MQILLYNIGQVLGITILHSLWQGLLVWILLRIVLASTPDLSALKKYNIAAVAMLAIVGWFTVTLFKEACTVNWQPADLSGNRFLPDARLLDQLPPIVAHSDRYYYVIAGYLPYISIIYLTGLVVNLLKLGYCRVKLSHIKKALTPAGDLQWLADELAEQLNVGRYVMVNFSSLVDVPCMIGYLKPIILLPVSIAANLTVAETEAIILHELAHVKRNDYLVNLLQQVINSILFFNPFARIISRLISAERENCCDDLVVQTTRKPLVYARALLKLEESRHKNLALALAASSNKHHLLTRIERIMKTQQKIGNIRHLVLAIVILAGSLSSIAWLNPEIKNGKITVAAVQPAELLNNIIGSGDTTRKKPVTAADKKAKTDKRTRLSAQKVKASQYRIKEDGGFNSGMDDQKLEQLTAEVNRHAEMIRKYYDSEKFKSFSADMDKRGRELDAFYNNDKLKEIPEKQQKAAADYQQAWDGKGARMEKIGKQMELAGNKMVKYYNTKEFKQLNTRLGEKYNIDVNGIYDPHTEKYKQYKKELEQYLPADILKQRKDMEILGNEMKNISNDPELLRQTEKMRSMSDSIKAAYNNPQIQQQQDAMRKLGAQMRAYTDNPEIKKEKELLSKATAKLRAYTNSPAFEAKVKAYRSSRPNMHWNNNNENSIDNNKDFEVKEDVPPPPPEPIKP